MGGEEPIVVTDPLVAFLYLLLRDDVQPGRLERRAIEGAGFSKLQLTNRYLAGYAENLARRLARLTAEDCQALLDYVDGDEGPQGEAIQSVLPKLAAIANGELLSQGYDSPPAASDSSQEIRELVERAYANQGLEFDSLRRIGNLVGAELPD